MPVLITVLAMLIIVSIASTTKQDRDEASRKLARWNPLFIAIIVGGLAFMLWPRR